LFVLPRFNYGFVSTPSMPSVRHYKLAFTVCLLATSITLASVNITSSTTTRATQIIPYIVITSVALQPALQQLVDWKNSNGVTAQLVTTEEIAASYPGADLAAKIRTFIVHAYNELGTRWVLLGGGVKTVPMRYIFDPTGDSDAIWFGYPSSYEGYVPSDIYYATIDNDWFNSTSGRYDANTANLQNVMRQVSLGRLPADDLSGMQNMVSRIVKFERSPNSSLTLLQIGINMTYSYGGLPAFSYGVQLELLRQRYFESWNTSSIFTSTPDESSVVDALNQGRTLVNIGASSILNSLWGTEYDPENPNGHYALTSSFYSYHDAALINSDLPSIVWMASGLSGAIDGTVWANSTENSRGMWSQTISPNESYYWIVQFPIPGSILYLNGNISSQATDGMDIYIKDPSGNLVVDYGRFQYNFSLTFIPPKELGYKIVFDNGFSPNGKAIYVSYQLNVTTSDLVSPIMKATAGPAAIIAETRSTYFSENWFKELIGHLIDSFYNHTFNGGYRGNYIGESLSYARSNYLSSNPAEYISLRPLIATVLYGDPQMAILRGNVTFNISGPSGRVQGATVEVFGSDGEMVSSGMTDQLGQTTIVLPFNFGDAYRFKVIPPTTMYPSKDDPSFFIVGSDSITINFTMILGYNVTICSLGSDLPVSIYVDGISYPANHTFLFAPDSDHTFSFPYYITDRMAQVRFKHSGLQNLGDVLVMPPKFNSDTDGWTLASDGAIHVTDNGVITIAYVSQYYINLSSIAGGPNGGGWYDENSTVFLSVASEVSYDNLTRLIFVGWETDWPEHSTSPSISLVVRRAYTFKAMWQRQYYLNVTSPLSSTFGSGWQNESSVATFGISECTIMPDNSSRRVFVSWNDGDPASVRDVNVTAPLTYTAIWKDQYLVTIDSVHPTITQPGWYDSGTTLKLELVSDRVETSFLTYDIFEGWKVNGSLRLAPSVTVDSPLIIETTWHVDYSAFYLLMGGMAASVVVSIGGIVFIRRLRT